jgi:hypothetical protein
MYRADPAARVGCSAGYKSRDTAVITLRAPQEHARLPTTLGMGTGAGPRFASVCLARRAVTVNFPWVLSSKWL